MRYGAGFQFRARSAAVERPHKEKPRENIPGSALGNGWQERQDSNPRPLVLETSALAKLSYAPVRRQYNPSGGVAQYPIAPIGLFKIRRVLRRATNYVTSMSDFRNRNAHRFHAGFTERPRFRRGDYSATNAPERRPKRKPAATRRPAQNAMAGIRQTRRPTARRLSHATPLTSFRQDLIQPHRQRHQHRQPRVR